MNLPLSRHFGMPGLRRLLTAATLAGALTVGPAGIAQAGTWSHTDPAGDVVGYTFDEENPDEEGVEAPFPEQKRGDIRRVVIAHSRQHVVIRFSMRAALPRNDWGVFADIRTRAGSFSVFMVRTGGVRVLELNRYTSRGEKRIRCAGLTRTIDGSTVRLVVPRSCIGDPRLVRVGGGIQLFTDDAVLLDDGLRDGLRDTLRLSPRIYRG